MRLPKDTTVYIGGKKYTRDMPDELAPEGINEPRKDTKPLKKLEKKEGGK